MLHELSIIDSFVKRSKRERYREFVSNERLRPKFTGKLAHFQDFDFQYRVPIPSDKLLAGNIERELQRRHSPTVVYAVSEDPALDQKEIRLDEAIQRIVGRGMGSILSCIPGQLIFVETEDERYILERHNPSRKLDYIRFVVGQKDNASHMEQGIFHAAGSAVDDGHVSSADADEIAELRHWFSTNLERPSAFGRTTHHLGICWFKTNATEHIARIWEMVRILERNGIYIRKIRTDRPGYVVYEDDWQIVAEPFRKGTITRR